ncbi:MAG: phosphatidylserine decarboxylase [Amaricoccus sp.]|uniref:phosphatidylserine decarboxylase n=1 Tax=Amaricoccus sp. TaxID=1872485 RepID=UPI0039E3D0E9
MAASLMSSIVKPMHPEGPKFLAIAAAITLLLFLFAPLIAGIAGLAVTVWVYYFFRDPARVTPTRAGLVVSPADGEVSMIAPAVPPAGLNLGPEALTRISIFMSVFDCHVNRAPCAGTVTAVDYRPGKFLNAALDKASEDNERNAVALRLADGRPLAVVQIAGLVARRILCTVKPGDALLTGERFGMIRFGSRLDVYLPDGVAPLVIVGQRAVAGETVLADLETTEAARAGEVR